MGLLQLIQLARQWKDPAALDLHQKLDTRDASELGCPSRGEPA
jgi:hypothetical protein